MRIIAIIVALLFIISCNNITSRINEVPLLIVTDFGRDVDDAQAFAFLAEQINGETNILDIITNKKGFTSKHNGIKPIIAGVICTGYIPEVRAKTLKHFLSLYNISVPIAIPTDREKDSIEVDYYYKTHLVDKEPYELTLLNELVQYQDKKYEFLSPKFLIDSLTTEYPDNLRVLIIAQPTQFTNTLKELEKEGKTPRFKEIFIQGQHKVSDSTRRVNLTPDFSAYNLREDSIASYDLFKLQDSTSFIFLSKHATYPYAITKEETEYISQNTKGGKYLKKGAIMGLKSFLERDSVLFYKIFNISPTINKENAIDSLEVLNNPYDLLTAIYIFYPDIFEIKNIGKHINVIN